jgi:outer membrane protease
MAQGSCIDKIGKLWYNAFKENLLKKTYALLLVFVLFVVSGFSVSAQSTGRNSPGLFYDVSLGLLNGAGEEIVYRDKSSDTKLSQLLWEMKPLFYFGAGMHYHWLKPEKNWGVFAGALYKFSFIPAKTGVMEDRDWMAEYYPDFLTHYSVHDNRTEETQRVDANIGLSFRIAKKYLLKAYVAYEFMHFSWTARGGSLLYPDWDINGDGKPDGDHDYLKPIDVITYKQDWHMVSPGIAFYGEFNRYFDLELSLKLSPFIWLSTKDNHLLRNLVITDNLDGGFFVEPSLIFSLKANNSIISISVEYKNISGTRGDAKYNDNGTSTTYKNMGGAGYSAFDVGITAKTRIGKK